MSLSSVQSTLSNLKSCQADIGACMDMVTDVALGIVEAQGMDNSQALKKLEEIILECSRLDSEVNCFVASVDETTAKVRHEPPEAMFNLKTSVDERFNELMAEVSDAQLQKHSKVVSFKQSIRQCATQGQTSAENEEQLDDDITVLPSQANLICPLTQVEMVNPVRNKKCNHYYDEEAIRTMIRTKHKQKKKCCCPWVGCANKDIHQSDLELDPARKRMIQKHLSQGGKS